MLRPTDQVQFSAQLERMSNILDLLETTDTPQSPHNPSISPPPQPRVDWGEEALDWLREDFLGVGRFPTVKAIIEAAAVACALRLGEQPSQSSRHTSKTPDL
jgi:hypothetical protein